MRQVAIFQMVVRHGNIGSLNIAKAIRHRDLNLCESFDSKRMSLSEARRASGSLVAILSQHSDPYEVDIDALSGARCHHPLLRPAIGPCLVSKNHRSIIVHENDNCQYVHASLIRCDFSPHVPDERSRSRDERCILTCIMTFDGRVPRFSSAIILSIKMEPL